MKPQIPWLRVFVEGVVIVGSILLAFGIDAAWDGRQERERKTVVLSEMLADLEADAAGMEAVLRRSQRWDGVALWLLRAEARSEVPRDSLLAAVTQLNFQTGFQPVRAAYASLQASGDFGLIEDAALRRAMSLYYEVDQPGYADYVRRGVVDHFFRMADEQADLIVFLDNPEATSTRGEGTGIGLRVGWDEIRRRPRFFHAVGRLGTWAASMIRRHDGAYAANVELREQIEAYLAR